MRPATSAVTGSRSTISWRPTIRRTSGRSSARDCGTKAAPLRQEADPAAAAMDKALKGLRRLKDKVGGRNKLAKLLGVTGPYLGRVLSGEKPMTEELVERFAQSSDKIAMVLVSRKI
jgi:hypothetical protein